MPPRRNILVIKHGALGDIIQGLDAFASLRHGHSRDHLAILTTPAFADLFSMMPYFDEVLTDNRASIFNLRAAWHIRKILRRDWDMVYDFQSSRRSRAYLDYLVHKQTQIIGHSSRATHPLPDMQGVNNAERMLRTAAKGGCKKCKADLAWLAGGAKRNKNRLVLVPGCSAAKPQKRWPAKNFAALARMFAAKNKNREVIMVGTAADRDVGDAVLRDFSGIDDRIGATDLPQLAKIFASAGLVIGNDTGPVFLAARMGTPTLMLMSAHTDPAMSAPVGARVQWLRRPAIAAIAPGDVFTCAMKLMGAKKVTR